MKYPRLFGRLFNQPLLLLPDKAFVLEQVFRAHALADMASRPVAMPDDDWTQPVTAFDSTRKPFQVAGNGIAVIPVMGTLVQRGSWMDSASGLTSYDRIASLMDAAVADPDIRSILLDIDSPGGEVSGLFTLTERIRRAAEKKPVWAFANEQAFSAAYAIAAAADRVYLPRTGMLGSIGVIAMHIDQSKRDAAQGYTFTPVFAGDKKADGSSHAPLSDSARADLQAEIDRLYGMFADHVADRRGVEKQSVVDTQAGLLNAENAVAGRFADGIASLEEVLAMLSDAARPQSTFALKGTRLMEPNEGGISAADLDQARTVAATEARQSERARIASILDLPQAQGREELARKLAMTTDMDAPTVASLLEAAPSRQMAFAEGGASPFVAAMSALGNPAVGASAESASADSPQQDAAKALADSILNAGK